ncbi:MAG: hypothetical protein WCH77_06700 [Planctomycetota bacterium]
MATLQVESGRENKHTILKVEIGFFVVSVVVVFWVWRRHPKSQNILRE